LLLVVKISLWRLEFNARSVHVRFVTYKLTLQQVSLTVLWPSPHSINPPKLRIHIACITEVMQS